MTKAFKILYPFYLLLALLFLECSSAPPIITDICNTSSDICNIVQGACSQVPPGYEDVCNIASDVCSYANTICQLFPGKLSSQAQKETLLKLQQVKNDLQALTRSQSLKINEWKHARLELKNVYENL